MPLSRGQKKLLGLLAVGGAIAGVAVVISKQPSTKFTYGGFNPSHIDFHPAYPAFAYPRDKTKIVNELAKYGVVSFMYHGIDPNGNWQIVGSDVVNEIRQTVQAQPYQSSRTRAGILGWFSPAKGWITIADRNPTGPYS